MADESGFRTTNLLPQSMRRIVAMSTLAASIIACSLAAQQQGPLPTPPASGASQPAPSTQSASPSPAPAAKPQSGSAGISHDAPAIPVEQIIQKMIAKNPQERYQRPVEVARALQAYAPATSHSAPPKSTATG